MNDGGTLREVIHALRRQKQYRIIGTGWYIFILEIYMNDGGTQYKGTGECTVQCTLTAHCLLQEQLCKKQQGS
jgi:hypothetical protein